MTNDEADAHHYDRKDINATWYFKTLEPSGTVFAINPLGNEFVVAAGRFDTAAGRKLLNAMIDALAGKCTRIAHTPDLHTTHSASSSG